jgi:PhoPQ-activated pathogenicity-related protein
MPKMILIGTNDEYWPVDAIKNYYNDIPGKNYIHYVPDAGHDLAGGEQALRALCAFWAYTLSNEQYPECSWEVSQSENGITLKVKGTPDKVINAYLWSADSEDRDFRDEKWQSLNLKEKSSGIIEKVIEFPENGYKAFYIDLKYKNLNGGEYTKSTRMFVVNEGKLL